MKLLILQITLCLFVASIKATNHGLLDKILKEFHIDVDTKLLDLFPDLDGISKFQTPEGHQLLELDACYNKKVGNTTFDIFKDNIHPIITHFFNTQATLNSRLDVTNFVSNLHILADNIISCVTNPIFTERSKLGITSMFIYSMSDYLNKILNNYGASEYSLKKSNHTEPENSNPKCSLIQLPNEKPYPKNFSWQDEGYVTPVRNQGSCGSCYVFATVGAMESQYMINIIKQNISFSEQAILNCMRPPYASSSGCDGGIIPDPIDRMINVGVSLTKDAPYIEKLNQCQNYPIFMKADDKCTYEDLNNDQIKRLVYRNGPAAVVLNAVQFKNLMGPFNERCLNNTPNHAVLLVGWNEKYWIMKNSWTANWGLNGYLYLPVNNSIHDNNCGFHKQFSQVLVNKCKNY